MTEPTITDIHHRLLALESKMNNGALAAIERNQEQIIQLARIITGDDALNVRPLRDEVRELALVAGEWRRDRERMKWFLGGLGVTNLGAIVTALISILGT